MSKVKKTLEKQLQLLSQCSKAQKGSDMSLYYLTDAMVKVCDRLMGMEEEGGKGQ